MIFNPYYTPVDFVKLLKSYSSVSYSQFFNSSEFAKFSLKNRTEYEIPFYNINGDRDYQINHILSQEYFEKVKAPRKELFVMENTTYGLLEARSEYFSETLHEIENKESILKYV